MATNEKLLQQSITVIVAFYLLLLVSSRFAEQQRRRKIDTATILALLDESESESSSAESVRIHNKSTYSASSHELSLFRLCKQPFLLSLIPVYSAINARLV